MLYAERTKDHPPFVQEDLAVVKLTAERLARALDILREAASDSRECGRQQGALLEEIHKTQDMIHSSCALMEDALNSSDADISRSTWSLLKGRLNHLETLVSTLSATLHD